MSIADKTRIKQDWPEDGYVFEVLDPESDLGIGEQAQDPGMRRIPCGKELHGMVADAVRNGYATGDEWQNTLDFHGVKHIDDLSEGARKDIAEDLKNRRKQRVHAFNYGTMNWQQGKTTNWQQGVDRLHRVGSVKSTAVYLKINERAAIASLNDKMRPFFMTRRYMKD